MEFFSGRGWKFSHISEKGITFTTSFWKMAYERCLAQSKSTIEWILNKKIFKNVELVKRLEDVHLTLHMGREQITLDER